jgi:hypothetical protein
MIFATLSNVLAAAGFDRPALPPTSTRDLAQITGLTLELRRTIAAIESCDMEAFLYPTDTPFDSKVMGNNYREKRTRSISLTNLTRNTTPKVFRTTEMGLKRLKRVDDRTRGMQRAEDILLQPTVVLGSDLQHLL